MFWINGELKEDGTPVIQILDRGFTLADGIFDTFLCVDGKPQYLEYHFRRLIDNAQLLKLPLSETLTFDDFKNAADSLVAENALHKNRATIRTTITRGPGPRGLVPPENPDLTIVMSSSPLPDDWARKSKVPVSAGISRTVRRNDTSVMSRIKSLNYGDNVIALLEGRDAGLDKVILMNTKENIACGTNDNFFACVNGRWVTPRCGDGAMEGAIRSRLLREGRVEEGRIAQTDIPAITAAFLTNSVTGVVPVKRLDHLDLDVQKVTYMFGDTEWEMEPGLKP